MAPDTKKDDEDGRAEGQIRFSTADSADALTDHGDKYDPFATIGTPRHSVMLVFVLCQGI